MGKLLGTYLFPHPPIIVEEIGRGGEKGAENTIVGVKKLAKDIKSKKPTTIIIITTLSKKKLTMTNKVNEKKIK